MKKGCRPMPLITAVLAVIGLAAGGGALAQQQTPPEPAAQQPSPWAKYMIFPCLSYTQPCSKAPTRKPVKKELEGPLGGDAARGKQIAFARDRGNCLACHDIKGGVQPGSRGLDLKLFGTTGRSDAEAYAMVYDMRTINPDTLMPPFGTNEILSDQDLRDVVAFLQSSK